MSRERWSTEETVRALYLYFQMPFGRLHHRAPEIIDLASSIGRTAGSVAMKLANFASLDPQIIGSGRRGLQGASALDRAVFSEFYGHWDTLVATVARFEPEITYAEDEAPVATLADNPRSFRPFEGPSEAERLVIGRRGQSFFRNSVLAAYEEQCCITGIVHPKLLNASHIRPWQHDVANRHNPANGLALSATFDRAFDRGLITVDQSLQVKVSRQLLASPSERTRSYFTPYEGKPIRKPDRFVPDLELLDWHNKWVFVDAIEA